MAGGETGDIYVWYQVEPTVLFAHGFDKHILGYFPDATYAEAAWAGEATRLDADSFACDEPIKLLRRKDLKRILGKIPKSTWVISPSLIPNTASIFRLSWPAYSPDGRVAYVMAGDFNKWKGSVVLFRLEKDDRGDWLISRTISQDFSLWGPGWPLGGEKRLFIED